MSWWPVSMWNGAQDLCIDHTKEMHSKTRVRCLHTPSRMAVMPLGVDEDVQQSDLTRCSWERAALWQYLPKLNRRRNRTFEPSNSSPHCKPERAKCVSTKRSVQAHHCSFDCNCPKGNSPVFPPGECVEFSPPQKQISLLHGRIFQMFSLRERSQTLMSTYCVLPVHTKFRSWSIIMGIEQWLPWDGGINGRTTRELSGMLGKFIY